MITKLASWTHLAFIAYSPHWSTIEVDKHPFVTIEIKRIGVLKNNLENNLNILNELLWPDFSSWSYENVIYTITSSSHQSDLVVLLSHNNDNSIIDGVSTKRRNSSALAMELRLSCTKPSIWRLWCQKQVSQIGISNCTPQYSVGCNYLSLPEIPASATNSYNICLLFI